MEKDTLFTKDEIREIDEIYHSLKDVIGNVLQPDDEKKLREHIIKASGRGEIYRNMFGVNTLLHSFRTARIVVDEVGLKRDAVLAIMLFNSVHHGYTTQERVVELFGDTVGRLIHGMERISGLYDKTQTIGTENFRNLLLSFAEDVQVVLILIADRVNMMRSIRDTDNETERTKVATEAACLFAPLAHKLGLYKLKSELEDLSLKYLEHDAYYHIREKLNATKETRDAYIDAFIKPLSDKLEAAGLKFHIKGRTKSIHSIWQKMKKQKCAFEGVYDLFAIRVILDSPEELEKMQCWQVYSIVTDMYQPNPKRLRDWLSVPKSNGYESLHITVLGPEQKWVEVQIRTERMDAVAERGLAAHWRYKGVKSEAALDNWLTNVRAILESGSDDSLQMMDQFKMDLYEDEVFVFSPRGDLFKFPKGATVLDFAYHIHSKIGNTCVGARINNKVVPFRSELHSGDTVEVMTQSTQTPKQEWIGVAKTSRAKAKIKLALREVQQKESRFAKEILERKFKNKKIDIEESLMMRTIKRMGYKEATEFYTAIAHETLDPNAVIEQYSALKQREQNPESDVPVRSASEFNSDLATIEAHQKTTGSDDVLVIDRNLKGIDYQLAKCCQPIYGDDVFGFVTVSGGIKIHRCDCPNAHDLRERFGYRIVKAVWSGKGNAQYSITLRVVGNDDIGIVNNLTSVISKEEKLMLRSISIDSHDGLFSGNLVVMVEDTARLELLIKKLRTIKGVKNVMRI